MECGISDQVVEYLDIHSSKTHTIIYLFVLFVPIYIDTIVDKVSVRVSNHAFFGVSEHFLHLTKEFGIDKETEQQMSPQDVDSPFHPGSKLKAGLSATDGNTPIGQVSPFVKWIANLLGKNPVLLQWRVIDMIERNVPFTNDVQSDYIFLVSGSVFFLLCILFLIMFCVGYYDALRTTFLSPFDINNYSDTSANQYCDTVSTTNTGVYLATQNGYWENSQYFAYSNASYYISLTSYSTDFKQYSYLMNEVYNYLVNFGNIVSQTSLTYSLVYWTATMLVVPGYSTQRFYLSGDPTVIFNKQHTGGVLTSINGPCYDNVTSYASYDSTSGIMKLDYNYQQYIQNEQCLNITQPALLGYIPIVDGLQFSLKYDVQTILTALAVNLYVIQLSALVELPHFDSYYDYKGTTYYISQYYSPKFPNMIPMICLKTLNYQEDYPNNATNAFLCGLSYNGVIAMPMFNQFGSNSTLPIPCDCSKASSYNLNSAFSNCNMFNFMSGFMFWNTQSPDAILELLGRVKFNYQAINDAAFNASFIDSYWGLASPLYDQLHSKQYRKNAYEFCQTSYGACSMVLFSSFDNERDATWAISKYYYILQNGACRDTISPTRSAW